MECGGRRALREKSLVVLGIEDRFKAIRDSTLESVMLSDLVSRGRGGVGCGDRGGR